MRPWWADGVYEFVSKRLNKNSVVFEWGSGASTECLSKICNVISIENDESWFNKLILKNMKNVDLKFIPDSGPSDKEPNDPRGYTSDSLYFNRKNFSEYVKCIDGYGLFDLIVIDGRARTSCLVHALDHLKIGGMLLLDDFWRDHYKPGIDLIPINWKNSVFKSTDHSTIVWEKL